MRLRDDESDLFYEAWLPLLTFVHEQTGLVPELRGRQPSDPLRSEQAVTLRDRLWQDHTLWQAFLAQNPYGLRPECLALVKSWEHRVSGTFCLFTFDRQGRAIFLAEDHAYTVLGLKSELADLFPAFLLPLLLKTTLLPFGDRIISDGLLVGYNVTLGPGIRGSYRRAYQDFKARHRVHASLPVDLPTATRPSSAQLDRLVAGLLDSGTTDRACEVAFRDRIHQRVRLPFQARLHGEPCRVMDIVLPTRGGLKALVRVEGEPSRWPLQDVSLVEPWTEGAEWIAAYQHWKESMASPSPRRLRQASRDSTTVTAARVPATKVATEKGEAPTSEALPAPSRPASTKRTPATAKPKPKTKPGRPPLKKWTWRF